MTEETARVVWLLAALLLAVQDYSPTQSFPIPGQP